MVRLSSIKDYRYVIQTRLAALSRRHFHMPASDPAALDKRVLFTITNGRSGSNTLFQLFNCVSCVAAHHESQPCFHLLLRGVQYRQKLAEEFLRSIKIPQIQEMKKDIYFEASNFFSKGYFEAALNIGLKPDLVILRRNRRKIALSMLRLKTVPGRTKKGRKYYLSLQSETLTSLPDHKDFTDYQMCYWHVLEIEARQAYYPELTRKYGGHVTETSVEKLNMEGEFERILRALEIPLTKTDNERIKTVRGGVFNTQPKLKLAAGFDSASLDEQEQEVLARVQPKSPKLTLDDGEWMCV